MPSDSAYVYHLRPSFPKVLLHLICWAIFITYELWAVYTFSGRLEAAKNYLIYYSINIGFFYAQTALLDAVVYRKKLHYLAGAGAYILLVVLNLLLKFGADQWLAGNAAPVPESRFFVQEFAARNMIRISYFSMFSGFYWFAGYMAHTKTRRLEAERKQLSTEKENAALDAALQRSRNAYLQQQINPHMLFNALNFVFNTVQRHSGEAAHCIWLLSEIMRFSLEEAGPDGKILLAGETEQLENLIAINRYRFRDPLNLQVSIAGDFGALRIIPLILLTLTENIFKHGDLTDPAQPALLTLSADAAGKLIYHSRNLKKSKNTHPRREPLGLNNIRLRLQSAYPENYGLEIMEDGDVYELTLQLNLCA